MKKILILLIFSAMTYASLFAEATTSGLLCNEEAEMANINVADFKIAINCNDGNWSATATAKITTATNHIWELWSTTVAGAISGGTLVSTITGGLSATFGWLDLSKHYYIVHYSEISGNPVSTRLAVPDFSANASLAYVFKNKEGVVKDNFCFGEDIFLDPSGTSNYDRYFMSVWRRPSGSNANFALYADYGWTYSNNIGTLNLSQLVRTSGENPGEIFEPGYVYELQFAIANPPNCIPWIELKRQFRVECCEDFISAFFDVGYSHLRVKDFELYENVGATHSWVILSIPVKDSFAPYSYEGEVNPYGPDHYLDWDPNNVEANYFLIHRVHTPCGDYCYGQPLYWGDANCELCIDFDCSVLDLVCFAPGNIQIHFIDLGFENQKVTWNAVPAATEYIVEVSLNHPSCCGNGGTIEVFTYHTTATEFYVSLGDPCISVRIGAVCGQSVSWSQYTCNNDHWIEPPGSDISLKSSGNVSVTDDLTNFVAYPNPATSFLNILLPQNKTAERIQLLNMQGRVVFEQTASDQQLNIDCKSFPAGMYTIRITYADQSQAIQKVQIIHP